MEAKHGFRFHKWLVLLSTYVVYCHIIGLAFALGSLFPTIMEKFGVTRAKASLLISVYAAGSLGGGVLYGALTDKYGPKWIGLLGASLTSVGLFLSFWASSLTYLVICVGAIKGCGAGMCLVTTSVAVRQHFTGKLCVLALSILVSGSGVGGMALIYLCRYLSDTYGLNGTLLILCGMDMNCAVLALLWTPPRRRSPPKTLGETELESTAREPQNTEQETKLTAVDNDLNKLGTDSRNKEYDQTQTGQINSGYDEEQESAERAGHCYFSGNASPTPGCAVSSSGCQAGKTKNVEAIVITNSKPLTIHREEHKTVPLQYDLTSGSVDVGCQNSPVNLASLSHDCDEPRKDKKSQTRMVKLNANVDIDRENVSPTDIGGEIIMQVNPHTEIKPEGLKEKLIHIMRVKSFAFTLIGLTFSLNCSLLFVIFIVDIIMDSGYTETEGALGLTILTVTSLLGRIAHVTLLPCPFDITFFLPITATALSMTAMILMAFDENLVVYYIMCCFLGNGFGVHISTIAVTSAQIIEVQYLPYAMGLLITVTGLSNLAVSPIAGAIRDVTGAYTIPVLITGAMNGVGLFMFILANCFHTKKIYV